VDVTRLAIAQHGFQKRHLFQIRNIQNKNFDLWRMSIGSVVNWIYLEATTPQSV
jgi:hypothetical protein